MTAHADTLEIYSCQEARWSSRVLVHTWDWFEFVRHLRWTCAVSDVVLLHQLQCYALFRLTYSFGFIKPSFSTHDLVPAPSSSTRAEILYAFQPTTSESTESRRSADCTGGVRCGFCLFRLKTCTQACPLWIRLITPALKPIVMMDYLMKNYSFLFSSFVFSFRKQTHFLGNSSE